MAFPIVRPALRRPDLAAERPRGIAILGSTGSIGISTLGVVGMHPDRYRVVALTANTQVERLYAQCLQFQPEFVAMRDPQSARDLAGRLCAAGLSTRVGVGEQGIREAVALPTVQTVMAAIVGAAGLVPTLDAIRAGRRVLLANKEPLVMLGGLIIDEAVTAGAELLPIDSEHNAIFQCLPGGIRPLHEMGVRRILLTCSGGPFRMRRAEDLAGVTPDEACAHPNWRMGRKISVDSATLMNKGLEVIEACHLFRAAPEVVEVVIHPQSIIHSMVEYRDGSVLAQLGNPDMRTPIAHALGWPERIDSGVTSLDLIAIGRLDFEEPDERRFPCLRLAYTAARQGGTAPAVLNAANEEAVAAFLRGDIRFTRIAGVIETVLSRVSSQETANLETVLQQDREARVVAQLVIAQLGTKGA